MSQIPENVISRVRLFLRMWARELDRHLTYKEKTKLIKKLNGSIAFKYQTYDIDQLMKVVENDRVN